MKTQKVESKKLIVQRSITPTKSKITERDPSEIQSSTYSSIVQFQYQKDDVSKDVIERLFNTHKRTIEKNEKKKDIQFQQEMLKHTDRPTISAKSNKLIMMKQDRPYQPIHSPMRYQQDMQNYKLKKQTEQSRKIIAERDKQQKEAEDIAKHFVHKQGAKLDMDKFLQKYNQQVTKHQQKYQNFEQMRKSVIGVDGQTPPSFSPNISKKSKFLTSN